MGSSTAMKCGLVQNLCGGVATPRTKPKDERNSFFELVWIKVVFLVSSYHGMSKNIIDVLDDSDIEVLHVRICKNRLCTNPNMYMYALYCVYTHGNDSSTVKQHNES